MPVVLGEHWSVEWREMIDASWCDASFILDWCSRIQFRCRAH